MIILTECPECRFERKVEEPFPVIVSEVLGTIPEDRVEVRFSECGFCGWEAIVPMEALRQWGFVADYGAGASFHYSAESEKVSRHENYRV